MQLTVTNRSKAFPKKAEKSGHGMASRQRNACIPLADGQAMEICGANRTSELVRECRFSQHKTQIEAEFGRDRLRLLSQRRMKKVLTVFSFEGMFIE